MGRIWHGGCFIVVYKNEHRDTHNKEGGKMRKIKNSEANVLCCCEGCDLAGQYVVYSGFGAGLGMGDTVELAVANAGDCGAAITIDDVSSGCEPETSDGIYVAEVVSG